MGKCIEGQRDMCCLSFNFEKVYDRAEYCMRKSGMTKEGDAGCEG